MGGGIFMASNLSDTTQVYNVLVPEELVGKGGDIEHLRSTLEEVLPHPARRRTTIRNGRNRDTDDQEFPIGPADLNDGYMKQVSWPIKLRANELFWMRARRASSSGSSRRASTFGTRRTRRRTRSASSQSAASRTTTSSPARRRWRSLKRM